MGSLHEGDREKLWLRVDFWDAIAPKLDRLQLTRRERARIEESIGLVVSRVPDEEAAAFKKEREEYWRQTEQLFRLRELLSLARKLFEGKRI